MFILLNTKKKKIKKNHREKNIIRYKAYNTHRKELKEREMKPILLCVCKIINKIF